MKTLYLVRHAEAGFDSEDYSDFKRKLTPKGQQSAIRLGQDLVNRQITMNKICASASLRTATTAKLIAEQLNYEPKNIQLELDLYNTEVFTLLDFVNKLDKNLDKVLLVNHNPTITNFAGYLMNDRCLGMNPATIAELEFELDDWKYVSKGTANLIRWESF